MDAKKDFVMKSICNSTLYPTRPFYGNYRILLKQNKDIVTIFRKIDLLSKILSTELREFRSQFFYKDIGFEDPLTVLMKVRTEVFVVLHMDSKRRHVVPTSTLVLLSKERTIRGKL